MNQDIRRARAELEFAKATAERKWTEYSAYVRTVDQRRSVADPEAVRRLREASEWQGRVYAEEHAAFKAEHGTPGIVGTRGEYQWLTLAHGDIASLLGICPEVVLGKYLAVTSVDSGHLRLSDNEVSAGWWTSESSCVFQQSSWGWHRWK